MCLSLSFPPKADLTLSDRIRMALMTRFNFKNSSRCFRSLCRRNIGPVFQTQIFGSFEDIFVRLGGLAVFVVSHLVGDPVELGHDMKQVVDNLDMRDSLFMLEKNFFKVRTFRSLPIQRTRPVR